MSHLYHFLSDTSDASLSSSSSRLRWAYDVFLSFRGEDTRKNFTDHLYTALVQAGVHTFRDDNELPRGEEISSQLIKAIQGSKIAIVVFSKGYASSTWCLDEIGMIMECRNTIGQIVLPVFYDIDSSDVRKQKRSFAEAFVTHEESFSEEMEKVNKWRKALAEAASLSGWDLQGVAKGHESKLIQKIVEVVISKLNPKYLNVATHPVGIDSQVKDMIALLSVGTRDVCIVGICGMPGIGKTTIAKAVYNQLCYGFDGSCCLLNIKKISEQPNGLVQLQMQLLSDALKRNFWIGHVDSGISLIKEGFLNRKVLLVLDDLDKLEQVNALVQERNWLGPGSRVIITTRDEHLLTCIQVEKIYQAKELNHDESLQLFCWHAFKKPCPSKDYLELSKGVVDYVGGLPLALEVIGSFLFGRSMPEWRSAMEKLGKIPHHHIQSQLRTGFDTLDDDKLKEMFLDIACFFVGMDKEYVAKILDARGFYSEIGFSVLVERCLIRINDQNELRMHDLLRDMGREIVRQMSPKHPGNRSRLWFHEDVLDVLSKQTGTKEVEGVSLNIEASNDVVLSTRSFAGMTCLQLLQFERVNLTGCYEFLSKDLTWLCWQKCPLESLAPNFQLDKLVVLDMQHSHIREVWKETTFLNQLKILNLSHSIHLVKTPNFLGLPSLERLILESCTELVEVHPSIGQLERLVFVSLQGCWRLENLPESFCYLKSLEILNISSCSARLKILPEHLQKLNNLRILLLGKPIALGPQSINRQKAIQKVFLPPSFVGFSSLRKLDLSGRLFSDVDTCFNLGSLLSLQDLNLAGNPFYNLPTGIECLPKLEKLDLCYCTNLQSILYLPSSLKTLAAVGCRSIERLSIQSKAAPDLLLSGCEKLVEVQGLESVENKPVVYMDNSLSKNFRKTLLQALLDGKLPNIVLPGSEVPDWFSHYSNGSSLSFCVPAISLGETQGLIVWTVLYGGNDGFTCYTSSASVTIREKRSDTELLYATSFFPIPEVWKRHSWVIYVPFGRLSYSIQDGEDLEVSVKESDGNKIGKCGVHLIANRPGGMDPKGTIMHTAHDYDIDEAEPNIDHLRSEGSSSSKKSGDKTC